MRRIKYLERLMDVEGDMKFEQAAMMSNAFESSEVMCRIYPKKNPGNLLRFINGGFVACLANTEITTQDKEDDWAIDKEDLPAIATFLGVKS